jgi:hypothetical protein
VGSTATSLFLDPKTPSPPNITIGVPVSVQPRVRVLDQNGLPIVNTTVVAFTWPQPKLSGT